MLNKGQNLRVTVYACYSLEVALNVGPKLSFSGMQDWKIIRQKTGEAHSTKAYITNDEDFSFNSLRMLH